MFQCTYHACVLYRAMSRALAPAPRADARAAMRARAARTERARSRCMRACRDRRRRDIAAPRTRPASRLGCPRRSIGCRPGAMPLEVLTAVGRGQCVLKQRALHVVPVRTRPILNASVSNDLSSSALISFAYPSSAFPSCFDRATLKALVHRSRHVRRQQACSGGVRRV